MRIELEKESVVVKMVMRICLNNFMKTLIVSLFLLLFLGIDVVSTRSTTYLFIYQQPNKNNFFSYDNLLIFKIFSLMINVFLHTWYPISLALLPLHMRSLHNMSFWNRNRHPTMYVLPLFWATVYLFKTERVLHG